MCYPGLHGRFRFSMSNSGAQPLEVASVLSAMAKTAISDKPSSACRGSMGACVFPTVQLQRPDSRGHKPSRLCGKNRRFAGSSYARRIYTAASAFPTQNLRFASIGSRCFVTSRRGLCFPLRGFGTSRPFYRFSSRLHGWVPDREGR